MVDQKQSEAKPHGNTARAPKAPSKPENSAADAFTKQEREAEKERIAKEERNEKLRWPKAYEVPERQDKLKVDARGPFDHLVGELLPGQHGWLPLDDNGAPSGPAVRDQPEPPQAACRVYAMIPTEGGDLLVTNSGAPLSDIMQPNTDVIPEEPDEVAPIKRSEERQRERLDAREQKREEVRA